jgi:hypothetical protein
MSYKKKDGNVSGGRVTERAVTMYKRGVELTPGRWACVRSPKQCKHDTCDEHRTLSFALAAELRVDSLLPCLLDPEPVFLLAVPDERPYRKAWAELKAELDAAVQS